MVTPRSEFDLNNRAKVFEKPLLIRAKFGTTIPSSTNCNLTMDLHHPLLREFPEHREFILWLKVSDEGFRRMFDEYHQVDDAVCRIEEQVDFATDQETDELKMKRAWLKDQMYRQLRRPAAAAASPR
jgi:uncharacterized protein YdcH (DUF465 family)